VLESRAVRAAFHAEALHFLADPQWIIPSLVSPLAFSIVSLMIFSTSSGSIVLYAVLGGGILGMWGSTLYKSGWSVNFDRMNGTLETLMMTPTPLTHVIAGRTIFNCLIGLLDALLVFLVAVATVGAAVALQDPLAFFIALFLTLLSVSAIGLLFAGLFVFTRASSAIMKIVEFPLYILCGAILPVVALPESLWPISFAIAPSWGVAALRLSAGLESGSPLGWGYMANLAVMVAISLAYVAAAVLVYGQLDRKARLAGSLGRW